MYKKVSVLAGMLGIAVLLGGCGKNAATQVSSSSASGSSSASTVSAAGSAQSSQVAASSASNKTAAISASITTPEQTGSIGISYQLVFHIKNLSDQQISDIKIRSDNLGDCAVETENTNSLPLDKNYAGYQWDCSSPLQPGQNEQLSIMLIPKKGGAHSITFNFYEKDGASTFADNDGKPITALVRFNISESNSALSTASSKTINSASSSRSNISGYFVPAIFNDAVGEPSYKTSFPCAVTWVDINSSAYTTVNSPGHLSLLCLDVNNVSDSINIPDVEAKMEECPGVSIFDPSIQTDYQNGGWKFSPLKAFTMEQCNIGLIFSHAGTYNLNFSFYSNGAVLKLPDGTPATCKGQVQVQNG